MKKATKFIFILLRIQCGEYQFNSRTVHEISKRKSTEKFGTDYAKEFYGKPSSVNGSYYFFHGDEVAVELTQAMEINEAEYKVLENFM